ncbi:hypothetical protein [Pseudogracilibacillus auburnensis]|uniref:hypothetical protein n=1 Tax=Pseudogracilibacillus auburnensis TaxID=1494959 RepID=UPI001A970BB2|nr:hypothetical protein [Pseudogracilibacillus auburnensis]MBO1005773.1 hypothetical protein [Pseudogracilibacillus auburnensis]
MSLVMAFATEDFAVLSGDLRRTYINDDNEFYDDTPKSFIINSRVLGGLSGDCDISMFLLDKLKQVGEKANIESVARLIRKELRSLKLPDIQQTVILSGLSDNGKVGIIELKHQNKFKIEKIKVPSGEIKWLYAFPYVDPGEIINDYFQSLDEVTIESISELAKLVNEKVSEYDIRVSTECVIHSYTN